MYESKIKESCVISVVFGKVITKGLIRGDYHWRVGSQLKISFVGKCFADNSQCDYIADSVHTDGP